MPEKKVVVPAITLKYSGLFDLQDLLLVYEHWLKSTGYDKQEITHELKVFEDGKHLMMLLRPDYSPSDYVKYILETKIIGEKMKDTVVSLDGKKVALLEGNISISIEGIMISDQANKMSNNAWWYFLKLLIDKYIYAGYIKDFDALLRKHVYALHAEISAYLNVTKYRMRDVEK